MIKELLLCFDFLIFCYIYNIRLNNIHLDDFQLNIGFKDYIVVKKPIIVDMKVTPHVFVSGLSGNGKSKMVEYSMQHKKVILFNVFEDDFLSLKPLRIINGNDDILNFLKLMLNDLSKRNKKSEPLYLVFDELLVLCIDKNITKSITDLLAVGRHYNIFIVGISQIGTKESVKFKDLFNTRICFKQVEESSYKTVLGYTPEDKNLSCREFYLYSDKICRGETYNI